MSGAGPATRSIELSVDVDAPVEAVWRAIADPAAVANWFAPIASGEPGLGGHITVSWGGGSEWTSRITAWEPFTHLGLGDEPPDDAAEADAEQGAAMELHYHLEANGGGTRLRLVNSGLSADPSWDDGVRMMTNGWRFFLWNLKHWLERHPSSRRTMISERPWVAGTRAEVWDAIFRDDGLGIAPARPGEAFTLRLDGAEAVDGKVVLSDPPWAFAAVLTSLDDGALHVEMEGEGERWKLGVWLSTYGLEEERCKRIGAALGQTVSRILPGQD